MTAIIPEIAAEVQFASPASAVEILVIERWRGEALAALTPEQIMEMTPREFALAFYGPCVDCALYDCNALTRARCESGGRYPL